MTVEQVAQQAFQDCEKYALFDAAGQVLASNFQVRSLRLALTARCMRGHKPDGGCVTTQPRLVCRHTQLDPSELQELITLLDDREAAIKQGMRIAGQRYEVWVVAAAAGCVERPAWMPQRKKANQRPSTPWSLGLQVHRFHPPLAYGRTMGCAPDASVGAALCKVERGVTGKPCFGVITYA